MHLCTKLTNVPQAEVVFNTIIFRDKVLFELKITFIVYCVDLRTIYQDTMRKDMFMGLKGFVVGNSCNIKQNTR